jgi:hypothetical protein
LPLVEGLLLFCPATGGGVFAVVVASAVVVTVVVVVSVEDMTLNVIDILIPDHRLLRLVPMAVLYHNNLSNTAVAWKARSLSGKMNLG